MVDGDLNRDLSETSTQHDRDQAEGESHENGVLEVGAALLRQVLAALLVDLLGHDTGRLLLVLIIDRLLFLLHGVAGLPDEIHEFGLDCLAARDEVGRICLHISPGPA